MKLRLPILLSLLLSLILTARAQVPFTGPDYTQNFNTLAASGGLTPWSNNTTLPGWFLFDRNGSALTAYTTFNSNTNTFISFGSGTASDRALGGVALLGGGAPIGAPAGYFAVALTNNTGHTIPTFNLKYAGEQWRIGTAVVANTTYLEYGFGATYAAVPTWTRPSDSNFHFTSPITTNGGTALAIDGNATANSIANLGGDITAAWASGATLWFRWVDINDAGNDHGLAIDNITIHEGPVDPWASFVPFPVAQDSWSEFESATNQGANPELRTCGGAAPKETFLKFDVKGVPGSVIAAKLRLYITSSQAGTKTQVYAANNNWSETALDWSARPDRKTQLVEVNNPDPAVTGTLDKYIDYDVTPYISGSGTFTFIVKSSATTDVTYHSREGANPPILAVNYQTSNVAADHNRLVTTVLAAGETYKERYAAPADISNIGIFDVTKQPYGADPTGAIDSTLAIQRAANEARDARVVAYFPAGTYLVSDTLNLVQGIVGYQIVPALGERWDLRDFAYHLVGPASGPRAKLVLAPQSPGFNDPTNPKRLAYFWSRGGGTTANENQMGVHYNQTLRNLDLDLNGASGNSGAIGVDMAAAQGASIHDLTINATGAYSGVHGTPGPGGSLTGVTIQGGRYGLFAKDLTSGATTYPHGHSTLVSNCVLLGQTESSIVWTGLGTMTLVGTRIEGTGIVLSSNSAEAGHLSVIDSIIRLNAGGAAVSGTRSAYLNNVYVENADFIAKLTTVASLAGAPGGWVRVKEYAGGITIKQSGNWDTYRANLIPPLPTHGTTIVPGFVDGVRFETPIVSLAPATAADIPADLLSRHALRITPSWNDADVINVKTAAGATGDNVTDDYAALQAAIDTAATTGKKVFLPKGDYRISAPLVLRAGTTLFGVNKNIAIIKPLIGAPAFANAGNPNPLVTTPDDASATTAIAEVKLFQRMTDTGVYLLQWRAGAGSQVRDVNFDRRNVGTGVTMHFPLTRIEGNGGGKWGNFWADSPAFQGNGYRHMLISGTTQPLSFYMFNPEADQDGIYNVEILGAANISVFACKLEGYHNTSIRIADSRNLRFFGFSGNAHPDAGEDRFLIENSEDFLFAMGVNQQAVPTADFTVDPNLYNQLREVRTGQPDIITPGWEQFTLYRRGQPGTSAPAVEIAVSASLVTVGTAVVFTPTISGPGPYTYQWFKNGSLISGATSATLSLSSAVVADTGGYTVTVSNIYGSGTSAPVTITVNQAPATITLGGLSRVYDGTPRLVTAATTPAGLAVNLTYNGSTAAPTDAGSYKVAATINDANYVGRATDTLIVSPAPASITLAALGQTYDGTPRVVTAMTIPAGLAVSLAYDGSATAPTNAGSYAITATVSNPNYIGSATGTLVVAQAPAAVSLAPLSQVYDGTPRVVTATTVPAGLDLVLTYDGSATAPTNAGSYAVTAVVNDPNYFGSITGTLVVAKSPATITLEPLRQSYDGTPRVVTATTNPAGLTVILTYDGSATAPTNPGSYTVDASVDEPNYTGTTSGTLIVTTTALVRHAPSLSGGLDGSIQVLLGENISLNGDAWVSGDLLVPGTPGVRVNGHPIFGGTLEGSGDAGPSDYQVTLNGNAILRHLVQRTDPLTLPAISLPPAPAGTRDVAIQSANQSIGDPATLRNLTLNGNAGDYAVPAGTYGTFDANGTSGFILGEAGATTPAVYNLQSLTLNGSARLRIVGPVVLVLSQGGSLDGGATVTSDPDWLALAVASGGLTLNGNASFIGSVVAPTGTVTLNGNATLTGRVASDRLTINGNGLLEQVAP